MAVITRTQVIHKPVDEVFDVLADLGSWAKWNPTIRSSRWLDDQPIGNGDDLAVGTFRPRRWHDHSEPKR